MQVCAQPEWLRREEERAIFTFTACVAVAATSLAAGTAGAALISAAAFANSSLAFIFWRVFFSTSTSDGVGGAPDEDGLSSEFCGNLPFWLPVPPRPRILTSIVEPLPSPQPASAASPSSRLPR